MTGVLCSFHYHRDTDLSTYPPDVPIFADSGAFSAATTGATIRLADYTAWLALWRDRITAAATLDVIGDPGATAANTAALHNAGYDVLPVFHFGSPLPTLSRLCQQHPYIALGGMVGKTKEATAVLRWLVACFRIGRDHGAVFHGFGQTRLKVLASLPFYSVDSSSWTKTARFAQLILWHDQMARMREITCGRPIHSPEIRTLVRSYGLDPEWLGAPGFALKDQRTPEEYRREYDTLDDVSAMAWHRLGKWLVQRHRIAPPPGQTHRGTVLYLADTTHSRLQRVAEQILSPSSRSTSP